MGENRHIPHYTLRHSTKYFDDVVDHVSQNPTI